MRVFGVRLACTLAVLALAAAVFGAPQMQKWSLPKAVEILNSSPWARHETFTRVVSGVGSGVSGEKEIFDTFYVRFLSAQPIREAFARIQQIQYGYDQLSAEDRQRFDLLVQPGLNLDVGRWVVILVSFRSNDPNEESEARRFFQKETTETLKNKAFLSTDRFSQVPIAAYYPPREEAIGAKFVFSRSIDGVPIASKADRKISFELLGVPGAKPRLRATFAIKEMVLNGELVY